MLFLFTFYFKFDVKAIVQQGPFILLFLAEVSKLL